MEIFWGVISLILLIGVGIFFYIRRKRKKILKMIREDWGKKATKEYNFPYISKYHDLLVKNRRSYLPKIHYCLDEAHRKDLDLDEVFKCIDRTISPLGQQYLYHMLNTPVYNETILMERKELADFFLRNIEGREKVLEILYTLKQQGNYHLPTLFLTEPPDKEHWIYPVLSFLPFLAIVASFFNPLCLLLILGFSIINLCVHYVIKKDVDSYLKAMGPLASLIRISEKIAACGVKNGRSGQLKKEITALKSLKRLITVLNIEKPLGNDFAIFGWLFVEYLKILFLFDAHIFFKSLKTISRHSEKINFLFSTIGEIESAISIASFRSGLPYYTVPRFQETGSPLSMKSGYHLLIPGCVPNDIHTGGRGMLITGSNMSGKTTFIRTVGLNAILAQTIYTCLAEEYKAPLLMVLSSIVIHDDINEGKSYYFKELERIRTLLEASEGDIQCLFILDEVFKGTNTIERISASCKVLAYLNKMHHIVLVATHDLELAELLSGQYNLYNFREIIKDTTLDFDYTIRPGIMKSGNAIQLLRLNGYPEEVVKGAMELSVSLGIIKKPQAK